MLNYIKMYYISGRRITFPSSIIVTWKSRNCAYRVAWKTANAHRIFVQILSKTVICEIKTEREDRKKNSLWMPLVGSRSRMKLLLSWNLFAIFRIMILFKDDLIGFTFASCLHSLISKSLIDHVAGRETTSLNSNHQRAYSSPKLYITIGNHGGMISTEENSWFVHQRTLGIRPAVV
jgi:hypothetical protein